MSSDDDRVAYLEGSGDVGQLGPDERAELDEIAALLAHPAIWEQPDAALEDRIVNTIRAAANDHPRVGTASSSRTKAAAAEAARPTHDRRSWRRSRLGLAVVGAAAVVVLLAGLAAARILGGDQRELQQLHVALADPDPVSRVAGDATLTRFDSGWEVRLDAPGLPRLANGRFYEAWLRNDEGVLVALGTFNEGRDVVLWAGVSPITFPTITVTAETADRNQESSGHLILTGRIGTGGR